MLLAEVVTLAKIFGKTVVDAFSDPSSFNRLTVLFDNNVDIQIVASTLTVVFGFGITVVLSTTGKVEDTAVVKMLVVTLFNAVDAVWIFVNLEHTSLACTGGPRQASIIYASREPMVNPVIYDNVIMLPSEIICRILIFQLMNYNRLILKEILDL